MTSLLSIKFLKCSEHFFLLPLNNQRCTNMLENQKFRSNFQIQNANKFFVLKTLFFKMENCNSRIKTYWGKISCVMEKCSVEYKFISYQSHIWGHIRIYQENSLNFSIGTNIKVIRQIVHKSNFLTGKTYSKNSLPWFDNFHLSDFYEIKLKICVWKMNFKNIFRSCSAISNHLENFS